LSNAVFTINFAGTIVSVHKAWNMVSLPDTVTDQRATSVFPTATSSAYAYDNGYLVKDTLQYGTGYWLKFGADQDVGVNGPTLTTLSVSVKSGWNLIGTTGTPLATSTIMSTPPGITTSEFFGYNGQYLATDTLVPGHAYWVKTDSDGQLNLSSPGSASARIVAGASGRIHIVPTNELPPPPPGDFATGPATAPREFQLHQNYPNPFNPTTDVRYEIRDMGYVTLKIYDILGKTVATLAEGPKNAGEYSVRWNTSGVPSGIYFAVLREGSLSQISKMVLAR
jgi:hypothetical protein